MNRKNGTLFARVALLLCLFAMDASAREGIADQADDKHKIKQIIALSNTIPLFAGKTLIEGGGETMLHIRPGIARAIVLTIIVAACFSGSDVIAKIIRLDCGAAKSPVMNGYTQITTRDAYSASRGYGWESDGMKAAVVTELPVKKGWTEPHLLVLHWEENVTPITTDNVFTKDDLVFRADVPNGVYRVTLTVGDYAQAIGSMDISINGQEVAENVAAWSPGTWGKANHRRMMADPWGWWNALRRTVEVKDGYIRVTMKADQSYYDKMIEKQSKEESAWGNAYAERTGEPEPYGRVGVKEAPYYYCGWPFVHNSLMSIEIVPHKPAPVTAGNDELVLEEGITARSLVQAVERFNKKDIEGAIKSLEGVAAENAQAAKAIVTLWCIGRLETEFPQDKELLAEATAILEPYVAANPDQNEVADLLTDAKVFQKGWELHEDRGKLLSFPLYKNHFVENCKAIAWWWMIPPESPLYYQARLNLARAEHMLIPYFPSRGTFREVFRELEKTFPNDRFIKYALHEIWENHGDGSNYYDWVMNDYHTPVKDAPEWVKSIYPAFMQTVDWSEWWIKFRQEKEGAIGGGWGDDVEVVGLFGYMGFVSDDVSEILVDGTARLVNGLWNYSEVDPELGFSAHLTDAEHVSEYTGNTLGMMCTIDYGNPVWIERSMKTAKLLRDLWTDYDKNGRRHFRASYFSAAQVETGNPDHQRDVAINYRAIRPANAVLWYNNNPTLGKVISELADSWVAGAMSTEKGKPKGVMPAGFTFPDGYIGGPGWPNWCVNKTGKARWSGWAGYRPYLHELLRNAYLITRDPKYFEPLRYEFELAAKYGNHPTGNPGYNLQKTSEYLEFGKVGIKTKASSGKGARIKAIKAAIADLEPGSEEWCAKQMYYLDVWPKAKRLIQGRKGKLPNNITKEDVIKAGMYVQSNWAWKYPLGMSEAGPTDRVGFAGMINPFCVYTGGRYGGPMLEACVTYRDTTRNFAAAVLGSDGQGIRLLYYSLAPDTREISMLPWWLEPAAKYRVTYGPDLDGDDKMDSISETKVVDFPQRGIPMGITVKPKVNYVVEIEQVSREGRATFAPDPALSPDDIRMFHGRLMARIHNIGSESARDVWVEAWDGDPNKRGKLIGKSRIPHIAAPIDLTPQTTTVAWEWEPKTRPHEVYIVVDPDDTIKNEITSFNNVAHKTLNPAQ
ncbi:hypothetical protein ACFL1X_03480 [Candidatus Hydrogenedentota bacterium]